MTAKQLIVNADDFGRHELINVAVERAFNKGCLRSTTLMAGGEAFENAVEIAKRNPSLGVGIHFTLANGNPILTPEEIPSLVTSTGKFHNSYIEFLKLFLQGKIIFSEIRAELSAQLEKIQRTGLNLTHFDSHQHLHHIPGIINITIDLAKSANIKAMRTAGTKIFDGKLGSVGQFIGRLGLETLAKFAGRQAHKRDIITPEHFAGIVAGESVSESFVDKLIDDLKDGTTEIMLHPGMDNKILTKYCQWDHDFEEELRAVTSPEIIQKLKDKNIAVVNFAALVNKDE